MQAPGREPPKPSISSVMPRVQCRELQNQRWGGCFIYHMESKWDGGHFSVHGGKLTFGEEQDTTV